LPQFLPETANPTPFDVALVLLRTRLGLEESDDERRIDAADGDPEIREGDLFTTGDEYLYSSPSSSSLSRRLSSKILSRLSSKKRRRRPGGGDAEPHLASTLPAPIPHFLSGDDFRLSKRAEGSW
jgi:hypothetical protein